MMIDALSSLPIQCPAEIAGQLGDLPTRTPAQRINDTPGELNKADGINCEKCKNKGYIAVDLSDGSFTIRDCECKATRRSLRLLRSSGLEDLIRRYTFKNFHTPDEWTRRAKEKAWDYVQNGRGAWFLASGKPGTGKTHLCTAICRQLIIKGAPTRYMVWREEAPKLKALVTEEAEYTSRIDELTRCPVLYIDDFFKGRVTDADINLAFTILNARYNSSGKRTILSSELSLAEIRRIDEAIGSRIYQRAKDYTIMAPRDAKNWRDE